MVQIANIFTAIVASAAVANASQHAKRDSSAVGATQVKAAVENYAELLSNLAANVGAGGASPSNAEIKAGLDTFMGMMQTFGQLQAPSNSTGFNPNWEGAMIGAVIAAQFGALSGGLLGAYTEWSFKGFQTGLANALGFDPIAALTGAPPPPAVPSPATPAVPLSTAPAAKASPAPAAMAPKPAAPPAAAKPAGGMSGMSGMSHGAMGHGPQAGAQDWE